MPFLAGAAGAIGRQLAPLLVADGWRVVGTTIGREHPFCAAWGRACRRRCLRADAFSKRRRTYAGIVVHQLTDLPPGPDLAGGGRRRMRAFATGDLEPGIRGRQAGVRRLIAQSTPLLCGWRGRTARRSADIDAEGARRFGPRRRSLERQVLGAPWRTILRYGRLYGPERASTRHRPGTVHVGCRCRAAQLAATRGAPAFNLPKTTARSQARKPSGCSAGTQAGGRTDDTGRHAGG